MSKGLRLKEFREFKNLTQQMFAENIGYTQVHISAMEHGRKQVSADVSEAVAERYPELNLDWLHHNRGAMLYKGRLTKSDLPNEISTYLNTANEGAAEYKSNLIKVAEFDDYVVFKRLT